MFDENKVDGASLINNEIEFLPTKQPGSVKDVIEAIPRSDVEASTQYIIEQMVHSQEVASGSSRVQRGLAPSNKYQTATSAFNQKQEADESELAKLNLFIEDEKFVPLLVMDNYVSLSTNKFSKKIFASSGAENDLIVEVSPRDIKKFAKEDLPEVIVENSLLKEREREGFLQIVPLVIQHATLLAQQGADISYALSWAWKTLGIEPKTIERILPLNNSAEIAQQENKLLARGVELLPTELDNHRQHIIEHQQQSETPELLQHIAAHKEYIVLIARDAQVQQFVQQQQAQLPQEADGVAPGPQGAATVEQPNAVDRASAQIGGDGVLQNAGSFAQI